MIVRCIGLHLIPDPFPEGLGAFSAEELTVHLQQVGPFVGPMIDVIVVAHELIHQLGALGAGFAFVGEKFFDHVHAGRKAGKVEVNAADEIRIAAQAGWLNLHALPFGGGEPVDLAPGFRLFPDEPGAVAHCGYCCSGVGAFEACEHSRFAAALDGDQAGIIRLGDISVAALNKSLGSDIAFLAIGVGGHDAYLLFSTDVLNNGIFRGLLNGCNAAGVEIQLGARGDPFVQNLVILGTGWSELPAFVWHGAGGFQEHETVGRGGDVHAPAGEFIGEGANIIKRIVTAQG